MHPGIYILLLKGAGGSIRVGSRGVLSFNPGYFCYVGSALGSGGLSRVIRHVRLAEKKDRKPRWHIDYLLTSHAFSLIRVYCAQTSDRLECSLAGALHLPPIRGVGCSDCTCTSHLFFSPDDPDTSVSAAFLSLSLIPVVSGL